MVSMDMSTRKRCGGRDCPCRSGCFEVMVVVLRVVLNLSHGSPLSNGETANQHPLIPSSAGL